MRFRITSGRRFKLSDPDLTNFIAGCEFSGTVVDGGEGFERGARVFGAGQGAFAEYMAVAAEGLVRMCVRLRLSKILERGASADGDLSAVPTA